MILMWQKSALLPNAQVCRYEDNILRPLLYVRPCERGYEYSYGSRPWVFLDNCQSMEEAKEMALVLKRMDL